MTSEDSPNVPFASEEPTRLRPRPVPPTPGSSPVMATQAPGADPADPPPTRRRWQRRIVLTSALLVLSLAGGLAGYYIADTQIAAWVGSTPIFESTLAELSQAVAAHTSDNPDDLAPDLLEGLIVENIGRQVSLSLGTTIGEDQRREALAGNNRLAVLAGDPATRDFTMEWVDVVIASGDEEYRKAFVSLRKATPISVSPRYGTWDPASGTLR